LRTPASVTLLGRLWPALREDFEAALAAARGAVPEPRPRTVLREPVLRRLRADAAVPAPADPPGAAPRTAPEDTAAEEVAYDWVGALTRLAGTLVHRWLKRIADAAGEEGPSFPEDLAPVTRRWATELGVPAADLDAVCERVAAALRRTLADARGRWLLSGGGPAELAITGWWNGRLDTVVLDRVR